MSSEGLAVETAKNGEDGLAKVEQNLYDVVLLDLMLPGKSGLDVHREIRKIDASLPVVIITAIGTVEMAVRVIKDGAYEYITKPWNNEQLLAVVAHAVKQRQLVTENIQLKRALKERFGHGNIVGKSKTMLRLLDLVGQIAPSRTTVLIDGESGTGKELIAKAIHLRSPRVDRAFVPVNSGSLPVDLLESTLFGHVRGAFTSAIATKKGLFEAADQGTIFFDEIGTIGLETQAKLLRVIQEREFMRLGDIETIKVDVRIIAATNANLQQLVEAGRFREDLYYRLNVIKLQVPSLKERKEDIPLLVDFFIKRYCQENGKHPSQLKPEVLKKLVDYDWPGNVRELENTIERAVVLAQSDTIGLDLLTDAVKSSSSRTFSLSPSTNGDGSSLFDVVDSFERHLIIEMLQRTSWNQTAAANQFRVPLSTLNQKIKRHKITIQKNRERQKSLSPG